MYLSISIVEVTIPTLYGITERRKYGNCVKPTDLRKKVLIGKHVAFSAEKSAL